MNDDQKAAEECAEECAGWVNPIAACRHGFLAGLAFERDRAKVLLQALEEMHAVMQNRQYEGHVSLTSMPAQNGCLVHSEWKIRAIKEKAIKKYEGETE